MQITIDTKNLLDTLEVVARVTTKHLTLPILQCVLIEVKKDTTTIKGTNLEVGIIGTLTPTKIESEGVVAVPAAVFLQTINLIPQPTITLSLKNDVLIVSSKTSKTEIKTIPPNDFPTIPQVVGEKFTINTTLLSLGIQTTAPTASQSSIKPELGSVYIHQKKEHSLTFVATDSFRLMEKTIPQKNLSLSESILIPYKNALELARVINISEGDVDMYVTENQCAISVGNFYITSRLVNGTFPDYEGIIPKEYTTTITLLTNDLTNALKKTNIFLNKFMQLTLTITSNQLTLSSQSSDAGTTTETINASVEGEDLTLNFNQKYIMEVLGHLTDDSVRLKCAGVGRPMVIENVHDKTLRYLVMPMNK